MRLAELSEATYDDSGRGSLKWYLKKYFDHQPDAYDDAGVRYYTVKPEYEISLDGKQIQAIEVDTYVTGHGYTGKPTRLKAWKTNNQPIHGRNFIHDFREAMKIRKTQDVTPSWA
ncbi:MAG: hypothetical protein ACXADH_05685 [Candidatus Kariarchaeaceae archaeon]|jgi:hypothetical protein